MSYKTEKLPGYWGALRGMTTQAWQHAAISYAAHMNSAESEMKWLFSGQVKYKAKAIVQYDRTLNGREK